MCQGMSPPDRVRSSGPEPSSFPLPTSEPGPSSVPAASSPARWSETSRPWGSGPGCEIPNDGMAFERAEQSLTTRPPLASRGMTFRTNVAASYVSQLYVSLIGIAMLPTYLRYMGAEAYGLVGLFAVVQAWFQVLDLGLSATLSREAARTTSGANDAVALRRLLRAMETFYGAAALIGGGLFAAGRGWISDRWLRVEALPQDEVRLALILMGAAVALRWIAGLYRSAVNGFEHQVWLGAVNAMTATARYVLIIPVFIFVGTSPVVFFSYQLAVGSAEVLLLVTRTYGTLKTFDLCERPRSTSAPTSLRGALRFSMAIAVSGTLWIVVTQSDKLLLSRMLPLSEYAYFTLAVVVASGITMIASPISAAILPRLSRLHADQKVDQLVETYRLCTQTVAILVVPITAILSIVPEQLLWAWTGDPILADRAAPVLRWYALGNGLMAICAFPYYLQYAHGRLRLHVIGSVLFAVVLLPTVWLGALRFGPSGAAMAWLGTNLLYAAVWVPLVHSHLQPGLHLRWVFRDVLAIAIPGVLITMVLRNYIDWPTNRLEVGIHAALIAVAAICASATASPAARTAVARLFGRKKLAQ